MGKSVATPYVPYVPCPKMKVHELGTLTKSMAATERNQQTSRRGHEDAVYTRKATSSYGVPRQPKPPDLCQGEHHLLHEYYEPSPALRGRGKAFTLPLFNGGTSRTFVSWLYSVEFYFEGLNFSEERKLRMVESCLRGFALWWYDTLNLSRRMEGKGRIRSWFKLEKKMRLKYLPYSILDKLWVELKTLKQNSLSVNEYTRLFEELHFVCDNEVSSFQKRIRFYLGLKSEIARRINLKMIHSFGELFELALCVERSLARPGKDEVLAKREGLEVIETVGNEGCSDQKSVEPGLEIACLKPESIEQSDREAYATSPVVFKSLHYENEPTPSSTVKAANQEEACTNPDLLPNASKDQVTDLDPLELIVNPGLPDLQALNSRQPLMLFIEGTCWDSIKDKATEESWVVPNSKVLSLNPCTRPDTCFKTSCLGGIIVVKLGVEPPWPFGKRYMDPIEKKTGMGTSRGNKNAHASSSNVQFSILVAELLSAAPMSPKQAIMVFDPGGRNVKSIHEAMPPLLTKQGVRKFFFFSYNQNLRSNSFEPGGVDAGARARGLSFLMPREQSMGLPKRMP